MCIHIYYIYGILYLALKHFLVTKADLTWGRIWGHLCRGEHRHKSKKPYTSTLWGGILGRLISRQPISANNPPLPPAWNRRCLRLHHEGCLPASQRCHIDVHSCFNNGFWICFLPFSLWRGLVVTWPSLARSPPGSLFERTFPLWNLLRPT